LNYRKIEIRVSEGTIIDPGFLVANHVCYKVVTEPLGFEVRRKDAEFFTLRKILLKQFPHIILPPLPPKQTFK
jgi:hypothetical protein